VEERHKRTEEDLIVQQTVDPASAVSTNDPKRIFDAVKDVVARTGAPTGKTGGRWAPPCGTLQWPPRTWRLN